MPHTSDAPRLADLLARLGETARAGVDDLEAGRLLRFDPRSDLVLCATMLAGGAEVLVGYGSIALRPDATPRRVLADEQLAPGLTGLLARTLHARGRQRAGRVA